MLFWLFSAVLMDAAVAKPTNWREQVSPPVMRAAEPVLFVDLSCGLCKQLLRELREAENVPDIRLVYLIAVPPQKRSLEQMMWNISETSLYGASELGCQKHCSYLTTVSPSFDDQELELTQEDWLKRYVGVTHNTQVLGKLSKAINRKTLVPSLMVGESLHTILSTEMLLKLLEIGDNSE